MHAWEALRSAISPHSDRHSNAGGAGSVTAAMNESTPVWSMTAVWGQWDWFSPRMGQMPRIMGSMLFGVVAVQLGG